MVKNLMATMLSLALMSTSAMAYSQKEINYMKDAIIDGQVALMNQQARMYGLNDTVRQELVREVRKNLSDQRIAERVLFEADATTVDKYELIPQKLAMLGYRRLPAEDVIAIITFQGKLTYALPDEACKRFTLSADSQSLQNPQYAPFIKKFFASLSPKEVIRVLTMHTKAIKAEALEEQEPIQISQEKVVKLQEKSLEIFTELTTSLSPSERKRLNAAFRNPNAAPAADVCNTAKISFRVFEALDYDLKVLYSYVSVARSAQ